MHGGYIKLYRKILESELWSHGLVVRAIAVEILLRAMFKRAWIFGVAVERGELVFSQRELAKMMKVGRQVLRTSLAKLEKCEFLTQQTTQGLTHIKITKYEEYQGVLEDFDVSSENNNPAHNPAHNPDVTQRQPSDNPENKKERSTTPASAPARAHEGGENQNPTDPTDRTNPTDSQNGDCRGWPEPSECPAPRSTVEAIASAVGLPLSEVVEWWRYWHGEAFRCKGHGGVVRKMTVNDLHRRLATWRDACHNVKRTGGSAIANSAVANKALPFANWTAPDSAEVDAVVAAMKQNTSGGSNETA